MGHIPISCPNSVCMKQTVFVQLEWFWRKQVLREKTLSMPNTLRNKVGLSRKFE